MSNKSETPKEPTTQSDAVQLPSQIVEMIRISRELNAVLRGFILAHPNIDQAASYDISQDGAYLIRRHE